MPKSKKSISQHLRYESQRRKVEAYYLAYAIASTLGRRGAARRRHGTPALATAGTTVLDCAGAHTFFFVPLFCRHTASEHIPIPFDCFDLTNFYDMALSTLKILTRSTNGGNSMVQRFYF